MASIKTDSTTPVRRPAVKAPAALPCRTQIFKRVQFYRGFVPIAGSIVSSGEFGELHHPAGVIHSNIFQELLCRL
jgi:hypothetical protein